MNAIALARQVRDYASAVADGEEDPAPLLRVAVDADWSTAPHVAALLLIANEGLSDVFYRHGGRDFDPRLAALADAIGWTP